MKLNLLVSGWKQRRYVNRRLHEFEANSMIAEKEFNTLDNTAQYRTKVEPLKYCLYLFLGLIFLIISLAIIVHLFLYLLLKVNGNPVHPFINNLLEEIQNSKVAFFSTVIFALLGYYMMFCVIKGNVKFGLRFFCISFYPLV